MPDQETLDQLVTALTKHLSENRFPDRYDGTALSESSPGFFTRLFDPHAALKAEHQLKLLTLALDTRYKDAELQADEHLDTKRRAKESKARTHEYQLAAHERVAEMEAQGLAEILKHRTLQNLVHEVSGLRLDPIQEELLIKNLIFIFTHTGEERTNGSK